MVSCRFSDKLSVSVVRAFERTHIDEDERWERHCYIDQAHKDSYQAALIRQESLEHWLRIEENSIDTGELLRHENEGDEQYRRPQGG